MTTETQNSTNSKSKSIPSETIAIVGPTASGKSEVANLLCEKINGEVISADSMQIYKGMDIGTGKVMPDEMSVKHWGIDIVDPGEAYSVALYQKYARCALNDILKRGKTPVICGGTGFYVRSVIDDYKFPEGEQVDNPLREKYFKIAEAEGNHALWEILKSKDPQSAAVIHENNVVRVVRALELESQGKSYSKQVNQLKNIPQKYPAKLYGLKVTPDVLTKRINSRVDKMVDAGLVDEVKSLLAEGYRDALTSSSAIGYKELVPYIDGSCTLEEAVDRIKIKTRQYAKQQRTWFKKDKRIIWIDYDEPNSSSAVEYIISCIA